MTSYLRLTCCLTIVISLFSLTPIFRSTTGHSPSGTLIRFHQPLPIPLVESGPEAERQLEPLALATADFDEDGVADLISSYRMSTTGAIRLQRGNVDALFPYRPAAQQRKASGQFSSAPFLP